MRIEHFVQKIWQNPDDFLRGVLTAIATRKEKRAVPRRRVVRDPIGSGQWNTCRPLERGAESTSPPFTFTSGKKRRPISSPVSAHPPTLPSPPRALIIIAIPLLISDTPGAGRIHPSFCRSDNRCLECFSSSSSSSSSSSEQKYARKPPKKPQSKKGLRLPSETIRPSQTFKPHKNEI